jgi:hypothetical protein
MNKQNVAQEKTELPSKEIQNIKISRRLKEILSNKAYKEFTLEKKKHEVIITNPVSGKKTNAPIDGGDWKLWERVEANIKALAH